MKYLKFSNAGFLAFFLLLFAAPAVAQFEVSPDHFDEQPAAKTKVNASSKKKTETRLAASHPAADGKDNGAKQLKIGGGTPVGKPHPGRKSASTLATAPKRTSAARRSPSSSSSEASSSEAAPSLKAQASTVRRE